MKNLIKSFLIMSISTSAVVASDPTHTDTYSVNTDNSKVEWFAEKVTGKHNGEVNVKSGKIQNNHGKLTGMVTMDMTSIAVTDLEGKYKEKLENHLRSEDFFSVEEFGTATFNITAVEPLKNATEGGENFKISGDLTIKGITNPISFPANILFNGNGMTASGTMVVDRSKYNVRYGSPSFFADIGDKAIYDEFKLKFSITASK
jgi:polyisoprenoid-binding protein YceI